MSEEIPNISEVSIEPTTLVAGQNDVRISLRVMASVRINHVNVSSYRGPPGRSYNTAGFLGYDQSEAVREGGSPRNAIWSGTLSFANPELTDGIYPIMIYVYSGADIHSALSSGQPLCIGTVTLSRTTAQHVDASVVPAEETHGTTENTTGDDNSVTTLTFRGPVTMQNMTSESGECVIRITVRGQVIIDCECPQKPVMAG